MQNAELFDRTGIGFIFFPAFYFARFEDKGFGQNRKILPAKSFDAVGFGHGRTYEVPEGPSYGVAVAFYVAVPADGGDLLRHRGLFCYDDFHWILDDSVACLSLPLSRSFFWSAINLRS